MKLKMLTSDGLLEFRKAIASNPRLVLKNLSEISLEHEDIELFETNFDFDESIALDLPGNSESTSALDIRNCAKVRQVLPDLTRADAFDERLWVTLAMGQFHSYTLARWGDGLTPKSPKDDLLKFYRNHIVVLSARDRWRNQSISRLWWQSEYA